LFIAARISLAGFIYLSPDVSSRNDEPTWLDANLVSRILIPLLFFCLLLSVCGSLILLPVSFSFTFLNFFFPFHYLFILCLRKNCVQVIIPILSIILSVSIARQHGCQYIFLGGFLPTDVFGVFFSPMARRSSSYDIISMDADQGIVIIPRYTAPCGRDTSVYLPN
jgi:hypothetical protein